MRFVLYVFAWVIAFTTGGVGGVLSGVAYGVIRQIITGDAGDFPSFSVGFVTATIAWPLSNWLEARFGLNTSQSQGEATK